MTLNGKSRMRRALLIRLLIVCVLVVVSESCAYARGSSRSYSDTSGGNAYTDSRRKVCSNCKREVPWSSKVGDKCPHCGVRWGSDLTEPYDYGPVLIVWGVIGGLFVLYVVGSLFLTLINYFRQKRMEWADRAAEVLESSQAAVVSLFAACNRRCIVPLVRKCTGYSRRSAGRARERKAEQRRQEKNDKRIVDREIERMKERQERARVLEEQAERIRKHTDALHTLYMDMMCCIMCADENVDPLEVRRIRKVLKIVGIPWDDEDVKRRMKEFVHREETEGIETLVLETLNKIRETDVTGNGKRLLAPLRSIIKADDAVDPNEEKTLARFTEVLRQVDPLFDDGSAETT